MDEQADRKEAKRLLQEKQFAMIRKEILAREEALDKITLEKIRSKWVNEMIKLKVPEMQDHLKYILHSMEKLVEAETFRKVLFDEQRQEMVEADNRQIQSHNLALSTLYDIYENRIQDLYDMYIKKIAERKLEAVIEMKACEERESIIQGNLDTILYQMQLNRDKHENIMNCDMFLKMDDDKSKNTEKLENLRSNLEKKMEKRWGEIKATLSNYEERTKTRRQEYAVLKAKDDAESKVINQQMKKIKKLFEQLESMKTEYEQHYASRETMSLLVDLREEKSKFYETFKALKKIVSDETNSDENHMKILTFVSNKITKKLKSVCLMGEQILTLFSICRKLETEKEKVIPVGGSLSLLKHTEVTQKKGVEEATAHSGPGIWTKDYDVLHLFWRKAASVQLSKLALTKNINDLKHENKFLKKALAEYLNQITQNEPLSL